MCPTDPTVRSHADSHTEAQAGSAAGSDTAGPDNASAAGSEVAEFQVSGMSCSHCEHAVTTEVGQLTGVQSVDVSAATGRLVVTSATMIDVEQVLAAVDEAGYQATPAR